MNMKKILLSIILLALCLTQASADYYYKINLYNQNGEETGWSDYIKVTSEEKLNDKQEKYYVYKNGLEYLINGKTVYDKNNHGHTLPKKANGEVNLDGIYGIVFANGKGSGLSNDIDILEGDEYNIAWPKIREHIKYLELREYKLDTYNNSGYFMGMYNLEALELPKDGMKVGNGDKDGELYFANANKLKKILIYKEGAKDDKVEITDDRVKDKFLLDRVGKKMFSNCFSLSTKYINRLIQNVTEIKDNAFYADDGNRGKFSDETDNTIIEIPSSVKKIGSQAFYNRVKVTGLNIQGNGCLEIGSEAFRGCDELANITLDNITQDKKELKIYKPIDTECYRDKRQCFLRR